MVESKTQKTKLISQLKDCIELCKNMADDEELTENDRRIFARSGSQLQQLAISLAA